MKRVFLLASLLNATWVISLEYSRDEEGYPVGFLSDCPGSTKNSTIPPKYLKEVFFLVRASSQKGSTWKRYQYTNAVEDIISHPGLDLLNGKSMLFVSGYLDSTVFPFARMLGSAYNKQQYNVILLDATRITSYAYPVSARLVRTLGEKVAEILTQIQARGKLDPKKLELVGVSLGTHICSFIAKHFLKETGANISRITALDPAGPCFRHLGPTDRLYHNDADFVDVIHTNIDGLGIAAPLGDVDFYVNGGEYQLSSFDELPCSMVCSHIRSVFIWLASLEHPDEFEAIKCDSVQQARDRQCYGRMPQESVTMGLNIDRGTRGLFFLATTNAEPYFLGKDGLEKKNDGYLKIMSKFNRNDYMVLN